MKERLIECKQEAEKELAASASEDDVLALKVKYLGRKEGRLTLLLRELSGIPKEERPFVGKLANEIKETLEQKITQALSTIHEKKKGDYLAQEKIDVTLPGRKVQRGRLHPVTLILEEIIEIFINMGFEVVEGPEAELDWYNFGALNIPDNHPARDMHDTFYLGKEILLRTHTSPVQIRTMENSPPPIRIIAPGKVYRCDSDISHTPMFHQIEGLMVEEGISFADLKGVLTLFLHRVFGEETPIRFRPSFFPFTEPSAEVDIRCAVCRGKGCRVCSQSGWLEILGSGMVHPEVFRNVNYDPERISGFAFGMGIERIAMLKFGIDDIRIFYENDQRFLQQF
jgi:phenylalanyl-tRNA synthetase alpha chain